MRRPEGFQEWQIEGGKTWGGQWDGGDVANVSVIFFSADGPGQGPKLHKHPYPETFLIRAGKAEFLIGDRQFEAEAGEVVVVPADTPHRFRTISDGLYESIDIHVNPRVEVTWLE